jgi:hypothetical protein
MIKMIEADTAEEFENKINAFEKVKGSAGSSWTAPGIYATQTHILRNEGLVTKYIAVLFYREKVV